MVYYILLDLNNAIAGIVEEINEEFSVYKHLKIDSELYEWICNSFGIKIYTGDLLQEGTLTIEDKSLFLLQTQNREKTEIELLQEKVLVLTDENISLKNENIVQDELINITMLATDEMFTMLEPLLSQSATLNSNKMATTFAIFGKEENTPMVDMYVAMVQRGLKTIDEIPARYRAQVAEILAILEA